MTHRAGAVLAGIALAVTAMGPAAAQSPEPVARPDVVVTYSVLGAVVQDLVGDGATVTVLMGNGVDPHDWSPSARDIEAVHQADLVVANGLGLEEGLQDALEQAAADGVTVFEATDHITVRVLGEDEHDHEDGDHEGEDHEGEEHDEDHEGEEHAHDHGGLDPHFWVDPIAMRDVVDALGPVLAGLGVDVTDRQADLVARLDALDAEVRTILEVVPADHRELVTGHESMGYFADRYGFELIGAVIPSLSSQGEVSASQLSALTAEIREHGVPAIFTEIGTPQAVADAIAGETGVRVVQLPSHNLPADGSYATFIRDIATAIASALV
ncbi:MAG: zinc ABC transporter substrate-binding protein [Chloroflexi bacterium]|nr:zinc ABC transporter substrate-binding protein [Chloroflexota bacterium]